MAASDGDRRVAPRDLLDQLFHQRLYQVSVGCRVHDIAMRGPHRYVAAPPLARGFVEVVLEHHEVERLQQRCVDGGRRWSQADHVGHGVPVAADRITRGRIGDAGLLTLHDGGHVLDAGVVPLDGVRSLDRPRLGHPPKRPVPPSRPMQVESQLCTPLLDAPEDTLVGCGHVRRGEDHVLISIIDNDIMYGLLIDKTTTCRSASPERRIGRTREALIEHLGGRRRHLQGADTTGYDAVDGLRRHSRVHGPRLARGPSNEGRLLGRARRAPGPVGRAARRRRVAQASTSAESPLARGRGSRSRSSRARAPSRVVHPCRFRPSRLSSWQRCRG